MAALKESRKRRRRQDLDVPTWTGKSGTAGAPKMFLMQQLDNERRQASSSTKPRFGTANTFNPVVSDPISSLSSSSRFGRGTGAGFGSAGNGSSSSSSSLLAGMMERRRLEQGSTAAVHSSPSAASSPSSSLPGSPRINNPSSSSSTTTLQDGTQEALITKIRDYMMDQGGRVQSTDLVGHFQHQLADVEQLVFKKMLKGIAVLERTTDGTGWWKLKPEYY